mgnify:CR=1 FL=1
MSSGDRFATVGPGDRLDHLAGRLLGNPSAYRLIASANPTLDIWRPQPGKLIEVPRA